MRYLRRKNDDRRLTSIEQSKDSKINEILRILKVSEGAVAEGDIPSNSDWIKYWSIIPTWNGLSY